MDFSLSCFFFNIIILTATVAMLNLGRKGNNINNSKPSRVKSFLANAGHVFRMLLPVNGRLSLIPSFVIIWFSYLLKMYILALPIGVNIPSHLIISQYTGLSG